MAAIAACSQGLENGPLTSDVGSATITTSSASATLGQLIIWAYPTDLVNTTDAPMTISAVQLIPDGGSAGVEQVTDLTQIERTDNSAPRLGVDFGSPAATWIKPFLHPVVGYVLAPHNRTPSTVVFVVRISRPGRWRYRGFEVTYSMGAHTYRAQLTDHRLVVCAPRSSACRA